LIKYEAGSSKVAAVDA
jgi:hypothetical protein